MKAVNLSKIVTNKKYSKNACKIHPLNENEIHPRESNAPKSYKKSTNKTPAIVNVVAGLQSSQPTYVYEVTHKI